MRYVHWLLLLVASLGLLRALIVPAGNFHVDEDRQFRSVQVAGDALRLASQADGSAIDRFPRPGNVYDRYRGTIYFGIQGAIQLLLPDGLTQAQRLIVARLIGVSFSLGAVMLTALLVRELFPTAPPMWGYLAAGLIGLIPTTSDMLAGVNLDAAAALGGSLWLYSLARILRFGGTRNRWLLVAGAGMLVILIKPTAVPLLFAGSGLLLAHRRARTKLAVVALAAGTLVGLSVWVAAQMSPGVAHWYSGDWTEGEGSKLGVMTLADAAEGQRALLVGRPLDPEKDIDEFVQYLPESIVAIVRGSELRLQVSMRSMEGEMLVPVPLLGEWHSDDPMEQNVGEDWVTYQTNQKIPEDAESVFVLLSAAPEGLRIAYDDVRLQVVLENGGLGNNLIANPSFEQEWWQAPQLFLAPYVFNTRWFSLLDWQRTWPAWIDLARWLFANFWASFGSVWPSLTPIQLVPMLTISVLAALGMGRILFVDSRVQDSWAAGKDVRIGLWMLVTGAALTWGLTVLRAVIVPNRSNMLVWSSTRHASPALAAVCSMLAIGFLRWWPHKYHGWVTALIIVALFFVNILTLFNVQLPFYQCAGLDFELRCLNVLAAK